MLFRHGVDIGLTTVHAAIYGKFGGISLTIKNQLGEIKYLGGIT